QHQAGVESHVNALGEPAAVVDMTAEAMAEAMPEVVAVAPGGDPIARDLVCFLARHSRAQRGDGCLLRVQDNLINLALPVGRGSQDDGASDIPVIAADAGADVKGDEIAGLKQLVAGPAVGQGGARARSNVRVEGLFLG